MDNVLWSKIEIKAEEKVIILEIKYGTPVKCFLENKKVAFHLMEKRNYTCKINFYKESFKPDDYIDSIKIPNKEALEEFSIYFLK